MNEKQRPESGTRALSTVERTKAIMQFVPGHTTLNQMAVYQYLAAFPWSKQRSIVEYLGIPKQTVSRILIDSLEDGTVQENEDHYWALSEAGKKKRDLIEAWTAGITLPLTP